jgi:hypothetical protein
MWGRDSLTPGGVFGLEAWGSGASGSVALAGAAPRQRKTARSENQRCIHTPLSNKNLGRG